MRFWSSALEHFLVRAWNGEMVVYDRRSGDTHALDRLATATVKALTATKEISVTDLVDCVATELEEDEKAEPLVIVSNALDFLHNLGLVTCTER
jgi:PqqD family protein of HPr-rel-A system